MHRTSLAMLAVSSCGFPTLAPLPAPQPVTLALVAGTITGGGNADGIGSAAHFQDPEGIAVDGNGNLIIADTINDTIRRVTPSGAVSTLAGVAGVVGSADGMGSAARFNFPYGVAVDGNDNVYVADTGNSTVRMIAPSGVVTTLAGLAGHPGTTNGTGNQVGFMAPLGIAFDLGDDSIYVTDNEAYTIRKIAASRLVTTLAGSPGMSGTGNGTGSGARFEGPSGVAAYQGTVYVADVTTIRQVTAVGNVTTLAGSPTAAGSMDGSGSGARFTLGNGGITIDSSYDLIVGDEDNDTVRTVTESGVVTTLAGMARVPGSDEGTGAAARFYYPSGVARRGTDLFVVDRSNDSIRKIAPGGVVTTVAGSAPVVGSADGTGSAARFDSPYGVTSDGNGGFYVTDGANSTVRDVTSDGVVSTYAGAAGMTGSTDGNRATARFKSPTGLALAPDGTLYVVDGDDETIRKISAAGDVTTFAGLPGTAGSSDGTGTGARFMAPDDVVIDSMGNLYVADRGNHTIRKITSAGVTTTFAGKAGVAGYVDDMGGAARFNSPTGLVVDSADNLYVADQANDAIRKITPEGVVTTLAGQGGIAGSADGAGSDARFDLPQKLAIDASGNLYVADAGNSTLRKITPTGVTTTIAGVVGSAGVSLGDSPRLRFPHGVVVSGDSIVFIDAEAVLVLLHAAQ